MHVEIGTTLTIADVVAVASQGVSVSVADRARASIAAARAQVDGLMAGGLPVYGITTGVGQLASVRISPADRINANNSSFHENIRTKIATVTRPG